MNRLFLSPREAETCPGVALRSRVLVAPHEGPEMLVVVGEWVASID